MKWVLIATVLLNGYPVSIETERYDYEGMCVFQMLIENGKNSDLHFTCKEKEVKNG